MEKSRAELCEILNEAIRYNMVHNPDGASELGTVLIALCESYGMSPPSRVVMTMGSYGRPVTRHINEWADPVSYVEGKKLANYSKVDHKADKIKKGTGNEL